MEVYYLLMESSHGATLGKSRSIQKTLTSENIRKRSGNQMSLFCFLFFFCITIVLFIYNIWERWIPQGHNWKKTITTVLLWISKECPSNVINYTWDSWQSCSHVFVSFELTSRRRRRAGTHREEIKRRREKIGERVLKHTVVMKNDLKRRYNASQGR